METGLRERAEWGARLAWMGQGLLMHFHSAVFLEKLVGSYKHCSYSLFLCGERASTAVWGIEVGHQEELSLYQRRKWEGVTELKMGRVAWVFPGRTCLGFLPSRGIRGGLDPGRPLQGRFSLWRKVACSGKALTALQVAPLCWLRRRRPLGLALSQLWPVAQVWSPLASIESLKLGAAGPQDSGLKEAEVAAVASEWRRRKPWVWGPPTCPKPVKGSVLWVFSKVLLSG